MADGIDPYHQARKLFLKLFLVFISLTALVAIMAVLSDDFGDFEIRVLLTTLTISVASIASMACAAFIERRQLVVLGGTGILSCVIAAAMIIIAIWAEIEEENYWRSALTAIICATALAHSFLMTIPRLSPEHKWVQVANVISITILSIQIIIPVWGDVDAAGYFRIMAALSIIVGLETLAIPILMRIARTPAKEDKLELARVADNIYWIGLQAILRST